MNKLVVTRYKNHRMYLFGLKGFYLNRLKHGDYGMKFKEGDLIELAKQGKFDVIIHGCNCFNNMGKGIASAIKKEFPSAYIADKVTKKGSRDKLGTLTIGVENIMQPGSNRVDKLYIVNAYTQYSYGGNKANIDMEALESCFKIIKEEFSGKRIAFPKIGAGLARGNWKDISDVIMKCLHGEDITCVVLPN